MKYDQVHILASCFALLFSCPRLPQCMMDIFMPLDTQHATEWPHPSPLLDCFYFGAPETLCLWDFFPRWLKISDSQATNSTEHCCPSVSGLSYASHTVGFTPPTSLTRAGMSYYNSPGLHVQHMGASHGITVSVLVRSGQHLNSDPVSRGS